MGPEGFLGNQLPGDNAPRVVILGENQILVVTHPREPAVVRAVMLKEDAGPRRLKPQVGLPDFLRCPSIVPVPLRPAAYHRAVERPMEVLLCSLRQDGKVEAPPEGAGVITEVLALSM